MAKATRKDETAIKWLKFPDNSAQLRRVIFPNGAKGLMLTFAADGSGEEFRNLALEFGFQETGDNGAVVCFSETNAPLSAAALAQALNAELIDLPSELGRSYPYLIDCTESQNTHARFDDNPPLELGRNFRDQRVFRDNAGKRYRHTTDAEGHIKKLEEDSASTPEEFLRAANEGSVPQISAGLVKMAMHGTVGEDALQTVVDAACEEFDGRKTPLEPAGFASALREEMLHQIVSTVVGGGRENYHIAIKCALNAAEIIKAPNDGGDGILPTAAFLIFLRRTTLKATDIEFSGVARLGLAAPSLRSEGRAKYQLLDLTGAPTGGAAERASNALTSRTDAGFSILLVSGGSSTGEVEATRQALGRAYAFEAVAEIASSVAVGSVSGEPITVFFVGERRPRIAESLPAAAERTFTVSDVDELDALHTELLRSRRQISNWHRQILGNDADEAGDRTRQSPYLALSKIMPPSTMIPKSLEGATAKAQRRVEESLQEEGGADGFVSVALGIEKDQLKEFLTAEQVDAIAMREVASRRERGFLLADQTGIGKGRSLAAIARKHLREGGKVLYFTENAQINIPDVWRDLMAVQADKEARPCIMASRSVVLKTKNVDADGNLVICRTKSAAKRQDIYESGQWPSGANLVITNYSQFNGKPDRASRRWAASAPDKDTLLILDESYNAINQATNTGAAIRTIIKRVGRSNVVFATATPMRDPSGANLYKPLLPDSEGDRLDIILDNLAAGGETAQECFTTMLAEDGVFLRRDHNLSAIEFHVRMPDDRRLARYQALMNQISPLCELLIDATLRVGFLVGRLQEVEYALMIDAGVDETTARARTKSLYSHGSAAGNPLARLARLAINAIKVEQVVEEAENEIAEGRKPQITFHSTSAELFNEIVRNEEHENGGPLTFRHQVSRVANSIFWGKVDGERVDFREEDEEVFRLSVKIQAAIEALPEELSASPLDAVIEGLESKGLKVGEISGRSLAYRGGKIVRCKTTDRRKVVSDYNDGEIDVLIFNKAGATGGSFHAGPDFKDQRPRSLIEMETPTDIIKYIQAQGRGNRYGQVAKPRIVSVMTGLVPEMRLLQQRNRKLHAMGAIIDGNRSHPLLADDMPDFYNKVGDVVVKHVLQSNEKLARRLGFANLSFEDSDLHEHKEALISDVGGKNSGIDSLANRVLSRSLALSAAEQSRLIELIRVEFEATLEELDSRNANPLKVQELQGSIEVKATSLFSGQEPRTDIKDRSAIEDRSAFFSPLYMSTGIHHNSDEPISAEEVQKMVDVSRVEDGVDGFAFLADQVEMQIPNALRLLVRTGERVEDAITDPETQPYNFRRRLANLQRLVETLRNIKPGRVLQIGDEFDRQPDDLRRTIVKLIRPRPECALMPKAYKFRTVTPGHSSTELMNVGRLLARPESNVAFSVGLELGANHRHSRQFAHQLKLNRQLPVQILHGNLLEALSTAQENKLGSMAVYREFSGRRQRGIVITGAQVQLKLLPTPIASGRVIGALAALFREGKIGPHTVWQGSDRIKSQFKFNCGFPYGGSDKFIELTIFRRLKDFQNRYPSTSKKMHGHYYAYWNLDTSAEEIQEIFLEFSQGGLFTEARLRDTVNKIYRRLEEGELPPEMRLV